MFDYPNDLNIIFDKLKNNKIKPIIIGGYVRDKLLNIDSKDIDIELYGISSFEKLEEILEEFGDVNSVGKSFGVCKLRFKNLEIDFTLPRIDNKTSQGHRGFNVEIKTDIDFDTAVKRRDFTINAIGYDVIEKTIIDPFNGQDDLKNKILKAVDLDKFAEDPLRVLRAAGFCARFDLKIDDKLFQLCIEMCKKDLLNELAPERIFGEIKKILLKSPKPSKGFEALKNLDAIKYLSPLDNLDNNSFSCVMDAIDNLTVIKTNSDTANIVLMLSALCHKFDSPDIKRFILNLSTQKNILKDVLALLESDFKKEYSNSELLKLATKVNIEYFLILNQALNPSIDTTVFNTLKERAKKLDILNKKTEPFLKGRDIISLGVEPSEMFSEVLEQAYEAQLNLEITTHKEAMEWLRRYLLLKP